MTDSETIQLREKLDNLMTAIDNVDDFVYNNVDNEDVNNVKDVIVNKCILQNI